jgi:hypothetical protein
MLRNFPVIILICVGIAGCATKPVAVSDDTPQHPTAVIEQQIVSNGIKGFLPFETIDRHFVRANMRRDESTIKGTGTFTGFLVGTRSGTEITRIDRKLKWSLDTEKEEYTECPLKGCIKPARQHQSAQQDQTKPPEAKQEPGCTMHIAHTSFTVKATGQKKSINGFDTDEYQAAWVVKLRDNSSRVSTSTLNLDIWTTPVSGAMRDALAVEESYTRALNGAVARTGKPQLIPADAAKLISAYLASSLKPRDLKAFLDAGRQMEKIKGYPISTHLAWDIGGNACASRETGEVKDKSSPTPANAGDLVSGLAGIFAQKKTGEAVKESANEPILSFTFEVKKLAVEPVHDGEFTVPKNYRLVSQP